jgi:hypothetical protein
MPDWGVAVLGVIVLAASTLLFPLWTVDLMLVPLLVFGVLFMLLLRGPITSDAARGPAMTREQAQGDDARGKHRGRAV